MFEFFIFEIWNFQTISNGETNKTKVIDLHYINNFVIEFQILIWKSDDCSMSENNLISIQVTYG